MFSFPARKTSLIRAFDAKRRPRGCGMDGLGTSHGPGLRAPEGSGARLVLRWGSAPVAAGDFRLVKQSW